MPKGINPKSLANLKPAKPGEVRNPAGRPAAGLSIKEAWNLMADWPIAEIQKVAADESAPISKRRAAKVWLDDKLEALKEIQDRTVGKPVQPVQMSGEIATPQVVVRNSALADKLALPPMPSSESSPPEGTDGNA